MIKIYCEEGALTKDIKALKKEPDILLLSFPFDNKNKITTYSKKPTELTCDNTFITCDSDIIIGDTIASEKFEEISKVIGRKHYSDIRHVDTAYKESCQLFISPDKGDIIANKERLKEITNIDFFHCQDIDSILKKIDSIRNS
ncbi:MAG: hypothetical protein L6Q46_03690 [Flavobacterium sp.]|uniref:hypothetical protein n=1 Tax=Flavobacterium sp. TaxID=239 RepID=UPI0025BBBDF9|nr:hypothetical protein [Flavobacterium sp.]MCK6607390.1 hypothetical protein [Flavobacterium sp.]